MTARILQATMLLQQGRGIEAEVLLREVIAAGQATATVHAMLASCLRNAGLLEAARQEIRSALALDANCSYAHYILSYIGEEPGRARSLFSVKSQTGHILRALELSPHEISYLVRLAELRQAGRQWKESLEPIDAGLRQAPDHVGLAILRAEALIHLGRKQEASEILSNALASDPAASSAHAGMGWALLRAGNHRRAVEFFEEALRLRPGLGWAQRGALECAKHDYRLYRLLAHPDFQLVHRPLLRFFAETGFCAGWLLAVFSLLFWIDPIIRPRWGGGPIAALFVPLLVIPIALVFCREPLFSWLVRRHRAAQLSTTGPLVKAQANKWLLGLVTVGVTLGFAILLHFSKSSAVFAFLGLVPGIISLAVVVFDVPPSDLRKWLMAFSVTILLAGPVLMVCFRAYIVDLDPDPRCMIILGFPAIFIAIVSERIKAKNRIKEHQQAVTASQKKLTTK